MILKAKLPALLLALFAVVPALVLGSFAIAFLFSDAYSNPTCWIDQWAGHWITELEAIYLVGYLGLAPWIVLTFIVACGFILAKKLSVRTVLAQCFIGIILVILTVYLIMHFNDLYLEDIKIACGMAT